jgi:hypothetical protein
VHAVPNHGCNTYGYRVPFGYCDDRGFQGKDALKRGHENTFLTLTNMKIRDNFLHVENRSSDACRAECTSRCSCMHSVCLRQYEHHVNGDETYEVPSMVGRRFD